MSRLPIFRALLLLLAACNGRSTAAPDARGTGVTTSAAPTATASATDTRDPTYEAALAAIERESGGVLGVTAVHVPSGRRLSHRGGESFPMASSFKVAVALALVRRVERGELQLTDMVHLAPDDMRPGMGNGIAERWPRGADLALVDLAEAMIEQSDNTACDALLSRVGGPAGVTAVVREQGVSGLRVDRSELELGRDVEAEGAGFSRDVRDQTTPDAMAKLLGRILAGEATGPASKDELLGWMHATQTGPARLLAGLPHGTTLMHKTGTYSNDAGSNATNDVGIVALNDRSFLIVAAYLRDSTAAPAVREATLAKVASVAMDAFVGPTRR